MAALQKTKVTTSAKKVTTSAKKVTTSAKKVTTFAKVENYYFDITKNTTPDGIRTASFTGASGGIHRKT